jgi:exopolyphosphatase/guanosine-5'-triphosphate,3'-diphosphate pyrophosphatase
MKEKTDRIRGRWEWRIFDKDLSFLEKPPAFHEPESVQKSTDMYFVSQASENNIKIRHHTLDIKRLLQTNKHGFEQWTPILKELFPLSKETTDAVWKGLSVSVEAPSTFPLSLNHFLNTLKKDTHIASITVEKERNRYMIDGCMGEYSRICVNGSHYETIALEHYDDNHLYRTLQSLGWESKLNMNYIYFLKSIWDEHDKTGENQS